MSETEKNQSHSQSRRNFLRNSGIAVGGVILGGAVGSLIGMKPNSTETSKPIESHPMADYSEAMLFFTRKEDFDTLAAATEVIFPEDENGPGAIGLGAAFYIDKQLASPWGQNVDDYRRGPFKDGKIPLLRRDIYLQGIRKINDVSKTRYEKAFHQLKEEEQIQILQEFESGKIEMVHASSAEFFALLKQTTIEGCFCDPLYGGNKNLGGWKMKEFPGAYMTHVDVIESKTFVNKEPKSLSNHH
ncbi:gluconate 2-dehydrogenase subunit 3 family protein [Neobacillus niacini]|uniref:gluconate 2-dehydrogenase subunit 3 family protein n=1 Tax=Neobacillus niacini TaxID=86668 RepID=UPI002FFF0291